MARLGGILHRSKSGSFLGYSGRTGDEVGTTDRGSQTLMPASVRGNRQRDGDSDPGTGLGHDVRRQPMTGAIPRQSKNAARSTCMLDSSCSRYSKQSFEKYGGSAHKKLLKFSYLRVPY